MITTLAIENYRSLRSLVVGLGRLTVVTGANGTGKSSLYRALRLLADSSRNGAVAALAREGGLASTLWAGPGAIGRAVRAGEHPVQGTVRRGPVSLRLGFASDDFGYAIDFGLPPPGASFFGLDPLVKREAVWAGPVLRPSALLAERAGSALRIRDGRSWLAVPDAVAPFDSMLSEYTDPQRAPELLTVRERIRSWRFYDHLRTDAEAPARQARIGTRTPVLGHDGGDLAAALQTIRETGDGGALGAAVDAAFPGSELAIDVAAGGRFEVRLRQPGLLRPLGAAELSDGTLRYLLWVAALLSPRPPALLVLNEPETSLHPDLIRPLAGLILTGVARTQVVVVSHARALVNALEHDAAELTRIELVKELGETAVAGQGRLDQPPWQWPKR
ncbi:AAA family ATPase [Solwaraspora sp. WMMD1047]|uniref:AAA family ATPase n=1 Tax=Solwaraspora sp. WMMD1047 TaxID=3016102 RepID=UPI002415F8C3|nr:AAA family ATPase [Solwaraspora sp. WMMD1047]MDG4831218.1 AAA family ATPase [Solwaraspora sp. WMMD1047]